MRAVNQAVGRVIRHKHDYGAIILADERFAARCAQVLTSSEHAADLLKLPPPPAAGRAPAPLPLPGGASAQAPPRQRHRSRPVAIAVFGAEG